MSAISLQLNIAVIIMCPSFIKMRLVAFSVDEIARIKENSLKTLFQSGTQHYLFEVFVDD